MSTSDIYRIERDGNATYGGREGTIYNVYERVADTCPGGPPSYVHRGQFFALGFDRSDDQCLDHYLCSHCSADD